ncbi:uncharacterized protein LOC143305456 [Osmia lignaria lignaria]|uniref:uncharacterized protein LOC143305456 n=1 Tax=Osmia lignaria lignaria TaxID=1437193 RepID=UPI00402B9ACE
MRRIVGDYLRDRKIVYRGRNGQLHERDVDCGVPQGSAKGPTLWDLGYDPVLRVELPTGVSLTCFADDTHVLAVGRGWKRTSHLAEIGVAAVAAGIRRLGLQLAPHKTEAMWFYSPRRGVAPPSQSVVRVSGVDVQVGKGHRYLGSQAVLRRVERRMAIKVVRGHRTVTHAAAMTLAGLVPFKYEAEACTTIFWRLCGLRQAGEDPPEQAIEREWRCQARQDALDR